MKSSFTSFNYGHFIFQGEIRRALAQIGSNPFFSGVSLAEEAHIIDELAKGIVSLAQRGIGVW
ncbi:MAG: hypothetical protein R2827_05290 [Bdellovibrionales bacterium]